MVEPMVLDKNGVSGHDTPAEEESNTEDSSIKRDDTPESTEVIATFLRLFRNMFADDLGWFCTCMRIHLGALDKDLL
jgi:hypothetical protein